MKRDEPLRVTERDDVIMTMLLSRENMRNSMYDQMWREGMRKERYDSWGQ
jgi:hypothetical protein